MKNIIKANVLFYFKKIFPIAAAITFITLLILLIAKGLYLDRDTYLNWLFYEGAALMIGGFFFSLPIFGRLSQLKAAFYYPTTDIVDNIRKDWKKEISVGLLLNLLGLTIFGLLFSIYGIFLLFRAIF